MAESRAKPLQYGHVRGVWSRFVESLRRSGQHFCSKLADPPGRDTISFPFGRPRNEQLNFRKHNYFRAYSLRGKRSRDGWLWRVRKEPIFATPNNNALYEILEKIMAMPVVSRSVAALLIGTPPLLAATSALALPTIQDFEGGGTPYVQTIYSGSPGSVVLEGGNNFLRMTPAIPGSLNTYGFDLTQTGTPTSVTASFAFRMFGGTRADGFGFSLLNTDFYGTSGAAPSTLTEEARAVNSFGVGFDIFDNGETFGNNHVSLHYNGILLGNFNPGFDLWAFNDPGGAFAQISFVAVAGGTDVSVDLLDYANILHHVITDFFVSAPLYEGRIAFGARTGAATANHDLDEVSVTFATADSRVPEPGTLALLGLGIAGLIGTRRRGA